MGRLQGRRREGEDCCAVHERTAVRGCEVFRRPVADLLRPLDLQVRRSSPPRSEGLLHHPYPGDGRVPVFGGAAAGRGTTGTPTGPASTRVCRLAVSGG